MKNHAWLVCSDVVLTRMCLVDKGVECVPHCLLCENHDETLRHVFCLFPQVLSVGNRLSYGSRLNQLCNLHQTCNNCFLHLAEICQKKSSHQFCYAYYVEYLKTKKQQALGQHYRNTSRSSSQVTFSLG